MAIKPFLPDESLAAISRQLPLPREILRVATLGNRTAREAFVRLWLTEGCPQAFGRCPLLWEEVRAWLSRYREEHEQDDPAATHVQIVRLRLLGGTLVPREEFF